MFQNSGKKIMNYVKFVFFAMAILLVLGVVVATIIVWSTGAGFWVGVGVLFGGAIGACISLFLMYLSMLTLYAFGEMVQNSIEQTKLLRMLAGVKGAPAADPVAYRSAPAPKAPVSAPPAYTPPARPAAPSYTPPAPPAAPAAAKVMCPKCGARQVSAAFCKYCGTPMR